MGRSARRGAVVLVALMALFGAACGGDDDGGGDEGAGSMADFGGGSAQDGGGGDSAVPSGERADRSATEIPALGPSVIKTADLAIVVEHGEFQDAFQAVVDVAQKKGGFVLSSYTDGYDSRSGSVTLRVPAEAFASTLGEISALGTEKRKEITGEDVSEEFIDLEARLRNLSAQEAVILGLMRRASTIEGTIRVQNELTGIQLEIERLRGRLRYLEDQTALSTISVDLREAGAGAPQVAGTLERAWDVGRDTTSAIVAGILIGGAAAAPIAIVLLLLFLAFRWVRPRVGRIT